MSHSALYFTIHLFMHCGYVTVSVYTVEIFGPSVRFIGGILPSFIFAIGYASLSLTSFLLPIWRHFVLCQACIGLLYFPMIYFVPESPRFLFQTGKIDETILSLEELIQIDTSNSKGIEVFLREECQVNSTKIKSEGITLYAISYGFYGIKYDIDVCCTIYKTLYMIIFTPKPLG